MLYVLYLNDGGEYLTRVSAAVLTSPNGYIGPVITALSTRIIYAGNAIDAVVLHHILIINVSECLNSAPHAVVA